MNLAVADPEVESPVVTDEDVQIDPTCEALLDARYRCTNAGYALVRYSAHGCRRDGRGIVLCEPCLQWIAAGGVECSECKEAELFIVSTVKL